VSPALPESSRAQRDEDTDCEHLRIALRLGGGLVKE
jgi:hypothetical protein